MCKKILKTLFAIILLLLIIFVGFIVKYFYSLFPMVGIIVLIIITMCAALLVINKIWQPK